MTSVTAKRRIVYGTFGILLIFAVIYVFVSPARDVAVIKAGQSQGGMENSAKQRQTTKMKPLVSDRRDNENYAQSDKENDDDNAAEDDRDQVDDSPKEGSTTTSRTMVQSTLKSNRYSAAEAHESPDELSTTKGGKGNLKPAPDYRMIPDIKGPTYVTFREKIVHFDLKGAPPKLQYLQQVFPLLKKLGATGVLLEYEDMFPYAQELKQLAQGNAYKADEIKGILDLAAQNNLTVIPLVQTFGHLEFMLKYDEFSKIREVRKYPQVVCPSKNKTYEMIYMMLDQVVALHPRLTSIHIGADEAYYIAKCLKCQKLVTEYYNNSKERLMLTHVARVAKYLRVKYNVNVLMWHDILDDVPVELMQEFKLDSLVQPVIWGYQPDFFENVPEPHFPPGMFERFSKVFTKFYAASAFKGANGAATTFMKNSVYLANHETWVKLLSSTQKLFPQNALEGIILTGWQRFDHFAVLCELFPVAIPSLALNLQYLHLQNVDSAIAAAMKVLKCEAAQTSTPPIKDRCTMCNATYWMDCNFPGAEVHRLVEMSLKPVYENVTYMFSPNHPVASGWLSEYNLKHGYSKTFFAEQYYNKSVAYIDAFKGVGKELQTLLGEIYTADTVSEWLFQNVQVHIDQLRKFAMSLGQIANAVAFARRPLLEQTIEL